MKRRRNLLHPQKCHTIEDEEESEATETLQIHNVSNTTTYDEHNSSEPEDDSSEENSVNEIQPYT